MLPAPVVPVVPVHALLHGHGAGQGGRCRGENHHEPVTEVLHLGDPGHVQPSGQRRRAPGSMPMWQEQKTFFPGVWWQRTNEPPQPASSLPVRSRWGGCWQPSQRRYPKVVGSLRSAPASVSDSLGWFTGSGSASDVEVVTVELDDEVQQTARSAPWPPWVRFESGDGAEVVGRLGEFDLIFPDAPGGKIFKLGQTVAALRPGGVLIVDDMDLTRHDDEDLRAALTVVRQRLVDNAELVCAELDYSSGVIVAVKRRA